MADIDFTTQMVLWGYAVLGEVSEPTALLMEHMPEPSTHLWDLTLKDLKYQAIDRGRGWETPPYWFCLRQLPWSMREQAYAEQIDGSRRHREGSIAPSEGDC